MKNNWKKDYKKMLYDNSVSMIELSSYVSKNMPKYIYKYRSFDKYWKTILFDGRLYLPDALSLNDPFDCHLYVDTKKFSDFMNEFASKYVFQNASISDIEKVYNQRMSDRIKTSNENIRKNVWLTCFSENVNSILMWSHYAESHKGFCIEYDTERIRYEYKWFLLPVIYQREMYDYTEVAIMCDAYYSTYVAALKAAGVKLEYELKDVTNIFLTPMLIKAQEWNYEKEWRILIPRLLYEFYPKEIYLGNAINGVYLGANCDENSEEVKNIIKWSKEKKINVYKMEKEPDKYGLISSVIFDSMT